MLNFKYKHIAMDTSANSACIAYETNLSVSYMHICRTLDFNGLKKTAFMNIQLPSLQAKLICS